MITNCFALTVAGFSTGMLPSLGWLFAYLDPGTGSFALQLLIAGLFSGAYALKHYWRRVKGMVFGLSHHDD
jgi:hypothetical protein